MYLSVLSQSIVDINGQRHR